MDDNCVAGYLADSCMLFGFDGFPEKSGKTIFAFIDILIFHSKDTNMFVEIVFETRILLTVRL